MSIKIKPLGDKVFIKRLEAESKSVGGIIIPDSAKEKPQKGIVIAVGAGAIVDGTRVVPEVKVGDVVLFTKWGGTELNIDGIEHLLVKESDILAIEVK